MAGGGRTYVCEVVPSDCGGRVVQLQEGVLVGRADDAAPEVHQVHRTRRAALSAAEPDECRQAGRRHQAASDRLPACLPAMSVVVVVVLRGYERLQVLVEHPVLLPRAAPVGRVLGAHHRHHAEPVLQAPTTHRVRPLPPATARPSAPASLFLLLLTMTLPLPASYRCQVLAPAAAVRHVSVPHAVMRHAEAMGGI